MSTIADTLAHLAPHLPRALVSNAGLARLTAVASTLPAGLSRCLYVETRALGDGFADLIVDVERGGAEILAGLNPAIRTPAVQQGNAAWGPIIAFARAWMDPAGALGDSLDGAWLEFDLATPRAAVDAAPSLFVDFAADASDAGSAGRRTAALLEVLASTGSAPVSAVDTRLRAVIAALPPGAVLLYAGLMLARPTTAVRLCITGLTRDELPQYLARVGWSGAAGELARLVNSLAIDGGEEQPAIVHLDVGDVVHASIGLEYPLARAPQLAGTIAETVLLDLLVRDGLLSPADRTALEEWPGHEEHTRAHELWPSVVVRRVNHLKLTLSAAGEVRVKLYLCAEATPRATPRRDDRARG